MSDSDESLKVEDVERRRDLRGPMHDLEVTFPNDQTFSVVEASRKDFFAIVNDPEQFKLGDMHEITMRHKQLSFVCRVEVVRKSIHPRSGIALRLQHISPVAEETLKQVLAER